MFLDFIFRKKNKKVKKISLVLGGGGARGFYHVGVINALRELDIEIGEVVGASMGAIIGAMYCYNPNINFKDLLNKFNFLDLFDYKSIFHKKSDLDSIQNILKKYIKARKFSDFKIPLVFNATDIYTGESVVFKKGNIFPSIIASMITPGIMKPVIINNRSLCDGGVSYSFPINCVKNDGSILVSDISPLIHDHSNPLDSLTSIVTISSHNRSMDYLSSIKKYRKTFILRYEGESSVLNYSKSNIKKLIEIGYNDVMLNKRKIIKLVS